MAGPSRKPTDPFWDEDLKAPRFVVSMPFPQSSKRSGSTSNMSTTSTTSQQSSSQPPKKQHKPRDFMFQVVSDPTKPVPRSEMKKIRKHVMKDFITVSDGDPRAKRQRLDITPLKAGIKRSAESSRSRSPSKAPMIQQGDRPSSSKRVHIKQEEDPDHINVSAIDHAVIWRGASNVLYQPVSTLGSQTLYMATGLTELLLRRDNLHYEVNPFDSWPKFCNPEVEIERLKWLCSRCFRCTHLSEKWMPALATSSVAFYSTICISSAHDDAMLMEMNPSCGRSAGESWQRMAARDGVLKMINENLACGNIDDGTVIAVLHIIYSELITGDQKSVLTHLVGLHMVMQRRHSLETLGVNGLLATVVVITMYIAGVLGDMPPDPFYTGHATAMITEPVSVMGMFPEYPIYASSGFSTIRTLNMQSDTSLHLIELVHQATNAFAILHDMSPDIDLPLDQTKAQAKATLRWCHERIFAFQEASSIADKDMATFEVIRLASRVHIEALYRKIPYSEAVAPQDSSQNAIGARADSVIDIPISELAPILLQTKRMLKRSNFEGLWGQKRAVMLWSGLVILAAHGRPPADPATLDPVMLGECIAARRFISAVMVRCAIKLIFENTEPMLGMLKRFVAIQAVLRGETRSPNGKLPHRPREEPVRKSEEQPALTEHELDNLCALEDLYKRMV